MKLFAHSLFDFNIPAVVRCFKCPGDGQFNHPTQCDKFYECKKGKSRERLCPDGLVFSETIHSEEKCDRPFNVNCGNRTELQPPKSKSKQCRRKNGVFAHPDPSVCETYYNCADEEAQELNCPTGLWFDEKTGGCVWPHSSDREGCKTPAGKIDFYSGSVKQPNNVIRHMCSA